MFDNQLEIQKIEKSNELRSLGVNPYPHFLVKDMSIKEFRDKFAFIQDLEEKKATEEVSIAGRLKFKRVAGKSTFGNIEDESGKIQIYYSR
ncbi:MAG: lysine--tRNA ligase, partial [Campylobacter sp.]|nr:lysine--tRNA ligase [Campylobacter sp.]